MTTMICSAEHLISKIETVGFKIKNSKILTKEIKITFDVVVDYHEMCKTLYSATDKYYRQYDDGEKIVISKQEFENMVLNDNETGEAV